MISVMALLDGASVIPPSLNPFQGLLVGTLNSNTFALDAHVQVQ